MRKNPVLISLALVLPIAAFLAGCSGDPTYFVVGDGAARSETLSMYRMILRSEEGGQKLFVPVIQVANALSESNHLERLIVFLTDYVNKHPSDSMNAYYLYRAGKAYTELGMNSASVICFQRALTNHPDLFIGQASLHQLCLKELIKYEKKPEKRINYYKSLIAQTVNRDEKAILFYQLGKAYEDITEWDLSIGAYRSFLEYGGTDIYVPGVSRAALNIRERLAFHESDKNWTVRSLDQLIGIIRTAVAEGDSGTLRQFMSKSSFSTTSWDQERTEDSLYNEFGIEAFLKPGVYLYPELDSLSNSQEAYLKSTGWEYRLPTWYLYFRKVIYPMDPVNHNTWEWAGIVYGEKNSPDSTR
jgi:tetratricopeptide (TPR) repeat protein